MPNSAQEPTAELPFADLALEKLDRVLGPARGRLVFDEVLAGGDLKEIRTANDLYRFGELLQKRVGFESAVGALLTVAALLRGANASSL